VIKLANQWLHETFGHRLGLRGHVETTDPRIMKVMEQRLPPPPTITTSNTDEGADDLARDLDFIDDEINKMAPNLQLRSTTP